MNSFVQNGNGVNSTEELELTDGQLEAIFGAYGYYGDEADTPYIGGPGNNTYGSDSNGSLLSGNNFSVGLLDGPLLGRL
jgi:hypothetical protein